MEIFFMVLSVLGGILLWILRICLILLVLILFLLFCPIRYRIRTAFGDKWFAEGRVSYLLSAFSVKAVYRDGKLQSSIHLFGMDVLRILEWWKRRRAAVRKRKQEKSGAGEAYRKEEQGKAGLDEPEEGAELVMTEQENLPETVAEPFVEKEEEVQNFRKRAAKALQTVREKWKGLRHFWREVQELAGRLWHGTDRIRAVRAFLKLDNTKRMVCIFKDNVLHLWRKLKPGVLRGEVLFGTGDPCLTGQIFGAAAMLYAAYGKDVRVTPDFEKEILEGNLLMKGHITIMTLLIITIRIAFSSEWDRFRHDINHLKEAM